MTVEGLALTSNVLLVLGSGVVRAWRLTDEGAVDGIFSERRAGRDDSIWTVSMGPNPTQLISQHPKLLVRGQIGFITEQYYNNTLCAYDTRTGELCHGPLHSSYSMTDMLLAQDYFDASVHNNPDRTCLIRTKPILEGWMRGPGERHQLWLPAEWREGTMGGVWDPDNAIMKFPSPQTIIIKLY